jgi:protein SCO1
MTAGFRIFPIGCSMVLCLLLARPLSAQSDDTRHSPSFTDTAQTSEDRLPARMLLPDAALLDQEGRQVRFYTDLVKDKIVAINFIFTTCTTLCPRMATNFAKLQQLMADRNGRSFSLISISIDPVNDTPERLKEWSERFGARPGWSLLTGSKEVVDSLLKALGVFTGNKDTHSAIVLLGNDESGKWLRTSGVAEPGKLADLIRILAGDSAARSASKLLPNDRLLEAQREPPPPAPGQISATRRSFPDVALTDQNGQKLQLYSDLLRDKVVVTTLFSTSRQISSPLTTLAKMQDWLGDRFGKQVNLVSISVDPQEDTPAQLKLFAEKLKAKPGWYFVTGDQGNLNLILSILGEYAENKEQYLGNFVIGSDRTGLWIKTFGLTNAEDLMELLACVMDDKESLRSKIRL